MYKVITSRKDKDDESSGFQHRAQGPEHEFIIYEDGKYEQNTSFSFEKLCPISCMYYNKSCIKVLLFSHLFFK